MNNQDHAVATLGGVIRCSIAVLRLCVEDLRSDPTRVVMDRTVDESVTLSAAVAQLAKLVDLTTLDPVPAEVVQGNAAHIEEMGDRIMRIVSWHENGPCCVCGLALPSIC